jgi:hypothetical protein
MARARRIILFGQFLGTALLLMGCSHRHEMLWWDMMESHIEYQRVNGVVLDLHDSTSAQRRQIANLSDAAIAELERLEAILFTVAQVQDDRNERIAQPSSGNYYDHDLVSDTLIGPEPGRPATHKNSAEALRGFLDGHKRALEQATGMAAGELDVFLFTGTDLLDYSGTLNHWANVHFYHVPLATAIARLTRMKIAIRLIQVYALKNDQTTLTTDSSTLHRVS